MYICSMLKVIVKNAGDLEKALKRLKKKVHNVGVIKELRNRRYFVKPSVKKREQMLKAKHVDRKKRGDDE